MRLKLLLAAAAAAMTLTGCAADVDVSEKSYLRAAAVDGDKITLSFFAEEDEVLTVTAASPDEAKSAAELATGKQIFTGYTELIVLGDCDSRETLSFMLREWKVSPSCIVACPKGSGEKLLAERTAEELEGAVKAAQKQELAGECDVITALGGLLNGKGTANVPMLSEKGFCGTAELR